MILTFPLYFPGELKRDILSSKNKIYILTIFKTKRKRLAKLITSETNIN